MQTEKLYLDDSFLLQFDARTLRTSSHNGSASIVLDRTAFYPESGGQLGDRGTLRLGEMVYHIRDTQLDDHGEIHHIVGGELKGDLASNTASGEVDRVWRTDQMAQHTGQHMLSRAFLKIARAETISARLGPESTTIDLRWSSPDEKVVEAVEDAVNDSILDDRSIRVLYPSAEELKTLPLFQPPKVTENIRVIDVDGLDMTACGGTHCTRTGQVGLIHVVGMERYKGMIRITSIAGRQALRDYRQKDHLSRELSKVFSCAPNGVVGAVQKLGNELKVKSDALKNTRSELVELVSVALHAKHPRQTVATPILVTRADDDIASVRALAAALARRPDVLAAVACKEGESWLFVVERGADVSTNVGAQARELATALGGKGGGPVNRAEGRIPTKSGWDSFRTAFLSAIQRG